MPLVLRFDGVSTYSWSMIRYFRGVLEALEGIRRSMSGIYDLLNVLAEQRPPDGNVDGRVAALELSRVQWEADLEGLVAKAEGQYRAASNADARARTHAKAAEIFESDDGEGESDVVLAYLQSLSGGDEEAGERSELPSVRADLEYVPASPREVRQAKKAERRAGRA